MSTKSESVFEWSVKLFSKNYDNRVGIASQLKPESKNIFDYDKNAILYTSQHSGICIGSNIIHSTGYHKSGDIVHFRFQPQTKKFVVILVSL